MPWCPKCKSEYREGVTYCEDCKVDLVDIISNEPELVDLALIEKKSVAEKFLNYLTYSNIEAKIDFSDENSAYIIRVKEKDSKKAKKHFIAFSTVEAENSPDETDPDKKNADETANVEDAKENLSFDNETDPFDWERSDTDASEDTLDVHKEDDEFDENDTEKSFDDVTDEKENEDAAKADGFTTVSDDEVLYPESITYIKKSEQSKELKSTAVTFLVFGVLGIIYVALNMLGIISLSTGIVSYIVMTAVFIGFIVVGISSQKRAKKAAKDAVQEEELTGTLTDWLDQNVTEETLEMIKEDYLTSTNDKNVSNEIIYLKQIYAIKKKIIQAFGEMDDAYLETIVEEYYNDHFSDEFNETFEEQDEE